MRRERSFHLVPRIDDSRPAVIFGREVLRLLVGRERLSPEWAERILSWLHTGFSVHRRVRAKTKPEAERARKSLIRPVLSLERRSVRTRATRRRWIIRSSPGRRQAIVVRHTLLYI